MNPFLKDSAIDSMSLQSRSKSRSDERGQNNTIKQETHYT